jgi:hypothetical protein
MLLLHLAITPSFHQEKVQQTVETVRIRAGLIGSENWRCMHIRTVGNGREKGAVMSWTFGTGKIHNVGRGADETFPGLVSDAGAKLLFVGTSREDHSEILRYQDDFVDVSVAATRYANFRGPLLANDGRTLTDAWTVNFRETMIAPKKGVVLSPDILEGIKSNIESALLSQPLWPSVYGGSDLPARSVSFVSFS